MIGEDKIKGRINELESILDSNEELFHSLNSYNYYENEVIETMRRKILEHLKRVGEDNLRAGYLFLETLGFYRKNGRLIIELGY